jgi:hypothetical protein
MVSALALAVVAAVLSSMLWLAGTANRERLAVSELSASLSVDSVEMPLCEAMPDWLVRTRIGDALLLLVHSVDLKGDSMRQADLRPLRDLKRLGALKLENMTIGSNAWATVCELEGLWVLRLTDVRVHGRLSDLPLLRVLTLYGVETDSNLADLIQRQVALDDLYINSPLASDELSKIIARLPVLEGLTLKSEHITDATLKELVKCPNLRHLEIGRPSRVSVAGCLAFARARGDVSFIPPPYCQQEFIAAVRSEGIVCRWPPPE